MQNGQFNEQSMLRPQSGVIPEHIAFNGRDGQVEYMENYLENIDTMLIRSFDEYYKIEVPRILKNFDVYSPEKKKGEILYKLHEKSAQFAYSLISIIDHENIGEYEKKDLAKKVEDFYEINNLLLMQEQSLTRNEKLKKENCNAANIYSSKAIQYFAINLIKSGGAKPLSRNSEITLLEKNLQKTFDIYRKNGIFQDNDENFPSQLCNGIYGMAGAYQHYRQQGYRVLFPDPKLDASSKVDLVAINELRMGAEEMNDIKKISFESLKNIPPALRKYFYLVQVKCHSNPLKKTEGYLFKSGNKIDNFDYRNEKNCFWHMHQDSGFNGLYLDLKKEDALKLINNVNYN